MALLVVLLLLTPLCVVYGLGKAGRAHLAIASGRRGTLAQCRKMLVLPAVVAVTAGLALVHFGWIGGGEDYAASIGLAARPSGTSLYTGNGLLDVFLWIALSFGNLMVFLFFVSIPYVMGSLLAVLLVLSGGGKGMGASEVGGDDSLGGDPS